MPEKDGRHRIGTNGVGEGRRVPENAIEGTKGDVEGRKVPEKDGG